MKITTLLENRKSEDVINLKAKHGLSLYIETNGKKILFDTGPDHTFIQNAIKLGIDLSRVDYLIISHGHYDHGGGLKAFLEINQEADIYLSQYAFEKHSSKLLSGVYIDIGLNKKLSNHRQIHYIVDNTEIIDGIQLLCNVIPHKLKPSGNKKLFKRINGTYVEDDFDHEIYLVIKEKQNNVLFSGCSHKGIINIVNQVESMLNSPINTVIGGMHLYNPISKKSECDNQVAEIAGELIKTKVKTYYSCHCTGEKAYALLQETLKTRLRELKTGSTMEL
ncbi:MBL fold metallo-hydrolase [Vallitalea okinawensis]|uniref:MBL fold metallo-hydrolase n=1 Tax=Vallitalea okinawensis TaxID=2078660 RepID=UPI000CFD0598|nr:MBL fold metallo-hydrolase [Vallitalea okinawensis]